MRLHSKRVRILLEKYYFLGFLCHFKPIPVTPERIEKRGESKLKESKWNKRLRRAHRE